ncbi:hypothetical protein MAR_030898 [Mya arenaria]|uniref:Uncharacterized protein n=1 Tax=Mya arenaria TaxID=6604 RepID=A0ABY7F4J9_MYAAR|nr:hypothetical protein MAR_030898 [Mya arenaria]
MPDLGVMLPGFGGNVGGLFDFGVSFGESDILGLVGVTLAWARSWAILAAEGGARTTGGAVIVAVGWGSTSTGGGAATVFVGRVTEAVGGASILSILDGGGGGIPSSLFSSPGKFFIPPLMDIPSFSPGRLFIDTSCNSFGVPLTLEPTLGLESLLVAPVESLFCSVADDRDPGRLIPGYWNFGGWMAAGGELQSDDNVRGLSEGDEACCNGEGEWCCCFGAGERVGTGTEGRGGGDGEGGDGGRCCCCCCNGGGGDTGDTFDDDPGLGEVHNFFTLGRMLFCLLLFNNVFPINNKPNLLVWAGQEIHCLVMAGINPRPPAMLKPSPPSFLYRVVSTCSPYTSVPGSGSKVTVAKLAGGTGSEMASRSSSSFFLLFLFFFFLHFRFFRNNGFPSNHHGDVITAAFQHINSFIVYFKDLVLGVISNDDSLPLLVMWCVSSTRKCINSIHVRRKCINSIHVRRKCINSIHVRRKCINSIHVKRKCINSIHVKRKCINSIHVRRKCINSIHVRRKCINSIHVRRKCINSIHVRRKCINSIHVKRKCINSIHVRRKCINSIHVRRKCINSIHVRRKCINSIHVRRKCINTIHV